MNQAIVPTETKGYKGLKKSMETVRQARANTVTLMSVEGHGIVLQLERRLHTIQSNHFMVSLKQYGKACRAYHRDLLAK